MSFFELCVGVDQCLALTSLHLSESLATPSPPAKKSDRLYGLHDGEIPHPLINYDD